MAGLAAYHYKSIESLSALQLNLYHFEDIDGKITAEEIIKSNEFELTKKGLRQNFGTTKSIHWFKFLVKSDKNPKELSLEISNNSIHEIELFELKGNKLKSLGKTGDQFLFAERPIPNKTFVYPLLVSSYESATYFLKILEPYDALSTEINLWNTTEFENKEQRNYFLWGTFLGIGLIVIVTNLFFFINTSDQVYLWFSVYIFGILLIQMTYSGLAFQYLWPNRPTINTPDPIIQALLFYIPAVIHFQQKLLGLKNGNKPLFYISQLLKFIFISIFILLAYIQVTNILPKYKFSNIPMVNTYNYLISMTLPVFFWIGFVGIRSKDNLVKSISYGFLLQSALQIIIVVQNMRRNLTDSILFFDSYFITLLIFLIDLIGFSYLLAYRYRKSVDENLGLKLDLAENKENMNRKIIHVLEMERNQISKTLQQEVGLKLKKVLELLKNNPESSLKNDTEKLINRVNSTINNISTNTLPIDLLENGLIKSLTKTIEELNETQSIRFEIACENVMNLSIEQEVHLFRITNELINNILKHSKATLAKVSLRDSSTNIELKIEDNGIGIDNLTKSDGIGLKNIYERASEINAQVFIDSNQNGTAINIKILKQTNII